VPPVPPVPLVPLTGAVAAAMGTAARLRRGPAIHAVGTAYRARLDVGGTALSGRRTGSALLDEAATRPALVRLSRGAGLPRALPDVLGLAIRLDGTSEPERPQDLLLDSCGDGPVGRHLVRPGVSVTRGHYGTLIAYRVGERRRHLGAVAEAPGGRVDHGEATGRAFTLVTAEPSDREWQPWGRLVLLEPVPRPELRFSPANDGLGITPRADWTAFRQPSYVASQRNGPFSW
jgi:hypothetical protein